MLKLNSGAPPSPKILDLPMIVLCIVDCQGRDSCFMVKSNGCKVDCLFDDIPCTSCGHYYTSSCQLCLILTKSLMNGSQGTSKIMLKTNQPSTKVFHKHCFCLALKQRIDNKQTLNKVKVFYRGRGY